VRLRDWPLGGARAYGVVPSRTVSTAHNSAFTSKRNRN